MKLRSVQDLRSYLQQNSYSPEKFSALCNISNMTVRRWLKNEDHFPLPQKYWPIFDHAFGEKSALDFSQAFQFQDGFADLENHVHRLGETAHSTEDLQSEVSEKAKDANIAKGLLEKVKSLFGLIASPKISHYQRTLVLGGIVYFISPFDLVPDPTPIMGYLDDYAVATMVLNSIGHSFRKEESV